MPPESIFDINGTPDCSIFAPTAGYGADTFVSFVRSTLKVNSLLSQPRLNSSGETVLSFATIGQWLGSVQPANGNYVRLIQGTLVQVNYRMYIEGNADIRESDRATIEGKRVEVIAVNHWGTEATDIEMRQLGR